MYNNWTDDAILSELGSRLRQQRLNQNVSQTDLAEKAGVSWGTLRNAEAGKGSSVTTLIRLLRALGVLQRLETLLPEPEPSPLHLLQLKGEARVRASGTGRLKES